MSHNQDSQEIAIQKPQVPARLSEELATINAEEIRLFSAPNKKLNVTGEFGVDLLNALRKVPQLSQLKLVALPGTFAAGPIPEDPTELSILIAKLSNGNEADAAEILTLVPFYLHLIIPSNPNCLNCALVYRAFEGSWQSGIAAVLSDLGFDASNPINNILSIPSVNQGFQLAIAEVFENVLANADKNQLLIGNGNNE
jgi:hypothetical protein